MKILALEKEVPGVADEAFEPHLQDEAKRAWDLYQAGLVRELYLRGDWPGAVLMLECDSLSAAEEVLASLPLVRHGLIRFELVPLRPYPGFARLFSNPE
jgi:muconolactone delta-isomerase